MLPAELNKELGNIDLYLLDAILKGYIARDGRVLDAGCGEGRNLHWLLKNGYSCFGVDANPLAIELLKQVARQLQPGIALEQFQDGLVEQLLFPAGAFKTVICSAVLHFAQTDEQFRRQWAELCRVLATGGFLFIRTATDWGMQNRELELDEHTEQHLLPDGSFRFLLSQELLAELMQKHSLSFKESPKTVLLPNQRSMGVLMLVKE
jgi:SAM-dependent methyltransferase